jgi:hypothetical protein
VISWQNLPYLISYLISAVISAGIGLYHPLTYERLEACGIDFEEPSRYLRERGLPEHPDGIREAVQVRLFEPFFTTKPVLDIDEIVVIFERVLKKARDYVN